MCCHQPDTDYWVLELWKLAHPDARAVDRKYHMYAYLRPYTYLLCRLLLLLLRLMAVEGEALRIPPRTIH